MAKIINTQELDLSQITPDEEHWIYNGFDCCITSEVFENLNEQVDDSAKEIYEFSKSLQGPVLEMNLRGLCINKRRKLKVIDEIQQNIGRLEEQLERIIRDGVGAENVNWRSPKQLKELLYDTMQLPVQKQRNQAGRYVPSTNEESLEKLSMYFIAEPICNHILTLRGLGKSLGFLRTNIDPDNRMRTEFSIAGTKTGRFASAYTDYGTGTNLQNVTGKLRSIFCADPGMKFANLDLEQADSRNVGALCWNALVNRKGWTEETAGAYLDACESGDLHTLVTTMGYPDLEWETDTDRAIADQLAYKHYSYRFLSKKLGHGSNYLGQPKTMAQHARIPIAMAKEFQSQYFEAFPCIPAWHETIFQELEQFASLTTPFGRTRYFFDRLNQAQTRREAVSQKPQSMTADQINKGILRLWRSNRVQLLVQVHDSILFQYPEEQENEIIPWALEELKTPLTLERGREFVVPTEAETGWNWGYYDPDTNPDGLKGWKGHDDRSRKENNLALSLMDF